MNDTGSSPTSGLPVSHNTNVSHRMSNDGTGSGGSQHSPPLWHCPTSPTGSYGVMPSSSVSVCPLTSPVELSTRKNRRNSTVCSPSPPSTVSHRTIGTTSNSGSGSAPVLAGWHCPTSPCGSYGVEPSSSVSVCPVIVPLSLSIW